MIVGSMAFSSEMLETKKKLEEKGHSVLVPLDTEKIVNDSTLVNDMDADLKHCIETNMIKKCFDLVAESDAILVLNHKKNNIPGYIGTSALMEIGLAHFLEKKIFLLNKIPDYHEVRWAHEVHMINPQVINGELGKIE